MSQDARFSVDLPDDAATRALASRLAPLLKEGDFVALSGPIGAGKTEFCRALIRARAGAEIDVPSPSFTLMQTYDLPDGHVAHVDLYRLADPSELNELGLEEMAEDHLVLLEWPERAADALPPADLTLLFEVIGAARRVTFLDRSRILDAEFLADA